MLTAGLAHRLKVNKVVARRCVEEDPIALFYGAPFDETMVRSAKIIAGSPSLKSGPFLSSGRRLISVKERAFLGSYICRIIEEWEEQSQFLGDTGVPASLLPVAEKR